MGPLSMSAKQHREYLKLQSQNEREVAKMQAEEKRKQQLHDIKLKEAAAKANQGIGHKEDIHAAKLNEMGSPLSKSPKMNKQKLGIPTQNPLAGTGVFKQGQRNLYADGTEYVQEQVQPLLIKDPRMSYTAPMSDGKYVENIPTRSNNPGNLMYAGQANAIPGVPKPGGGSFALFANPQAGREALERQVIKNTQERGQTINQMMAKYAPKSENKTNKYVKNLSKEINLPSNARVPLDKVPQLAEAIAKYEGYKGEYANGTTGAQGSTDTVPAMLTPGEAVIPEPAAQNPANKPIIKALVEEGRIKNKLRDGAVSVVKSDAPSLAYAHPDVPGSSFVNGSMGVPEFSRGSSAQANYNNGTYGVVPQQVQSAAGYEDGTVGAGFMDSMMQGLRRVAPGIGMMIDKASGVVGGVPGSVPQMPLPEVAVEAPAQPVIPVPVKNYIANTTNPMATAERGAALAVPPVVNAQTETANLLSRYPVPTTTAVVPVQTEIVPVQTAPVIVPFTNPNANQTATYKPVNDIEKIDPFTLFTSAESGGKANAKNPLSSAAGPVQFTKDTWNNIRKQVPELSEVEYGSKAFYSEEAQRKAFEHTNKQNEAILDKQRIPLTNVNRYVMHGLGSGDGARVLANPNADFRETLNQSSRKDNADLIMKQNPVYAKFKTNQDYINWAEGHLNKSAGIGRDSLTQRPTPINPDPTQPEAVQIGTPAELQGVPPMPILKDETVSLAESDPAAANQALADVTKNQHSALDKLIAAIRESDKEPEVKQKEAASIIEQVYGDKGIFNQGDLIRFAITAAGGMLTGGSAAGSLRYASRDVLQQSDLRNRERIAAERQDKTINAQNARQDKSLLAQAALAEARAIDAENRADVKQKQRDKDALTRDLIKEGRDPVAVRKWIAEGEKGNLPPIKQSFIRSGQHDLVTVTQPFMFGGKRIDPGTPMYQYQMKDPKTQDVQTMVRIGDKDVPLEAAVASGIMLNKWDEGKHGPKAQVEDLQKWSDKSSNRFGEMMVNAFGADDVKGRPNPARQGQVTPMNVQTQAASWALSKGYKVNDPTSKLELEKINSIATEQAIKDMQSGTKVKDITPYLNASYIKQRSGLSEKLFELDPKKGTQMAPEKIVELRAKAANAGFKDDATMASEMSRLSTVWNKNTDNIQRKYKDGTDKETGFYMFASDVLGKMSKNK